MRRVLVAVLGAALFVGVTTTNVGHAGTAAVTTVTGVAAPLEVAIDIPRNRIYVAQSGGIAVIDGATNTVIATIKINTDPFVFHVISIAVNVVTNRIYASTIFGLAVIDGASLAIIAYVGMPSGFLATDAVRNRIYSATINSGTLHVVDGATHAVSTISIPASSPNAVVFNSASDRIYVADSASASVAVIDGSSLSPTGSINVGDVPADLAADERTNRIYVANYQSNSVSAIDGTTNTVVATIPVPKPATVALNSDTGRVYVGSQSEKKVYAIDEATNAIAGTPLQLAEVSYSAAVDAFRFRVYVVHPGDPGSVGVLTEDDVAPSPGFTGSDEIVLGAPVVGGRVNGIAVDDYSGLAQVDLNFVHEVLGERTPQPGGGTLSCANALRRSCTWSIPAPLVPGRYRLEASAVDRVGNVSPVVHRLVIVV